MRAAAIAGSRRRSAAPPPAATYPSYASLSAAGYATATSMTLPLPGGIQAGDVLVAATTIVASRNPVWPAGWTPIGAGFAAYRIADGTETGGVLVTWTGSSTQIGWVSRWAGAASGVGATRDNQAQSGTPATVAAVGTTAPISLCAAVIVSGSSTQPSTPTGFADIGAFTHNVGTVGSIRLASAEVEVGGDSSGNVSSAVSSTSVWRAMLVELKS